MSAGLYARYGPPLAAETESWQQNRRIFNVYNLYRLMLSLILLLSFYYRTPNSLLGSADPVFFVQLSIFYVGFNVLSLLLQLLRLQQNTEVLEYIAVIIVDILTLVLLSHTCGGVSSSVAHLLIVPIATGSILFGTRLSTFFAAIASIAAIYSEIYLHLSTSATENYFVQAGLLGLTLFATSLSLQYLGGRIRQKELINRQQAASILSLQEMNQQIIQRMQTGIVVVNPAGDILNCNDSARRLLQITAPDGKGEQLPEELLEQLRIWQGDQGVPGRLLRVSESGPELQTSFTFLQGDPLGNILIFLEDYSQLSSRAQHLKLMSLGRLTASIAHEVRNPLGAISHASQLLVESPHIGQEDQRLLNIINSHVQRVSTIIQNILELSRHRQEPPETIELKSWLDAFINRLENSYREPIECRLQVEPPDIRARFNHGQLEQLLTNLCDNGLRYSRQHANVAALEIQVNQHPYTRCAMLDVIDLGPGVPEERQEQIFEPFFTSEKSGTGLGLFICREICEANRAQLFFRRTENRRSCFRVVFSHPDRPIN